MGTSSSYRGPGSGSPLLPPWADNSDWESTLPDGEDPSDRERSDLAPEDSAQQGLDQESPDQSAPPVSINLHPAAGYFREYASSGEVASLRRGVNRYVKGMGGARNAARSARAGRSATRKLGGFLSDIATRGIQQALERFELGAVVGSSADIVLATVVDVLAPDGSSLDEAAARNATAATLQELYRRYGLEEGDISRIDTMDSEGVRIALQLSVTNYIYERLLRDMKNDLDGVDISERELIDVEKKIKAYIRETAKLELSDIDVLTVNWNGRQGEQVTQRVYEEAYAVWEAVRS